MRTYFVYILTNRSRTLYTGVTNDLVRRVMEHRARAVPGFTAKYHCTQLVYFEETNRIEEAIEREKQIKGWLRAKKIALIESFNPDWEDLGAEWDGAEAEEAGPGFVGETPEKEDSSLRSE